MLIGIDPGPVVQSFVRFDPSAGVVEKGDVSARDMAAILAAFDGVVACEYIDCYGMPVGSEVFATVVQIGRLYASASLMRLIPRRDVKQHLCNNAKAKDSNIRQALLDKVGPVGTIKKPGPCYGVSNHLWAALAVAVTAWDVTRTKNEVFFDGEV